MQRCTQRGHATEQVSSRTRSSGRRGDTRLPVTCSTQGPLANTLTFYEEKRKRISTRLGRSRALPPSDRLSPSFEAGLDGDLADVG